MLLVLSLHARAEFLIGLANIANLTGPNLEWAGDHSSYYFVPAFEQKSTGLSEDDFRWIAGMRHRMERGYTSTNGFYTGLIAGDLGGKNDYSRLGAGAELGYQWVKQYTRITVGSSLIMLEAIPEEDLKEEPSVVLGITLSLRK